MSDKDSELGGGIIGLTARAAGVILSRKPDAVD
jgi:hypothetical protein